MNTKIAEAQEHIEGILVARMIVHFQRKYRDVYGESVLASNLCAVGPLQTLLGAAIKEGLITIQPGWKAQE